jgi:hypothetical protein
MTHALPAAAKISRTTYHPNWAIILLTLSIAGWVILIAAIKLVVYWI